MSHYCDDPASVRVDFFKPSGKWYMTEAVPWKEPYNGGGQLQDHFRAALKKALQGRGNGLLAVCLEPYHENAYPVMVTIPEEGF